MPDGSQQSPENTFNPQQAKIDRLQFKDGALAMRISGGKDAPPYDLNDESVTYSPGRNRKNEAIISTESGNEYFIKPDLEGGTYVVNTRATQEKGKLVAVYTPPEKQPTFPLVEWGKPMKIGPLETTDVRGLLLSSKTAAGIGDYNFSYLYD